MRFSHNRHDVAFQRSRSRLNIGKFFLISCILAGFAGGVLWFVVREQQIFSALGNSVRKTLLALWETKDYREIIRVTEEELARNPMDADSLVFNGFAHFYTGVNQTVMEDKLAHIDAAITSLRRVLLHRRPPLAAEVHYVLGKAYYQKGAFYCDLSVEYMSSSLEKNFVAQDSYEYLGLAYNTLGEYEKSIDYLLLASEHNSSDLLYLILAQTYYQTGDKIAAEEFLSRSINMSSDTTLIQRARYLLGDIYLQDSEFIKAEDQFLKIVEQNPHAADAHFYLGEIYNNLGDPIRARASWRRAVRIDPNHFGARTRLYR